MPDPRDQTIDYLEISTRDIEASKKFFGELFGWQFTDYGSDYTSFNDGRIDGGFSRAGTTASVASGSVLIVFYAADLEGTLDRVKELGGTVIRDIFSFPGGRRFHFTDPSGNEFAVWSEPVE